MREQEIIRRYFGFSKNAVLADGKGVEVGVGDDAAVLRPPPGAALAMSTDTLNAEVHFFSDVPPFLLARKAAAVSLSDIAAMGAVPLYLTVALSAPKMAAEWFENFARGLQSSAAEYNYAIVGGDLTRAKKISVTTTAIGALAAAPLLRGGARAGDVLWVSGTLGGAAHALGVLRGELPAADDMEDSLNCLQNPQPRLQLGAGLAGTATAAMDLSDGLLTAAKTIAKMSGAAMEIFAENIPPAKSLQALSEQQKQNCVLCGGDDYELLFSAPQNAAEKIARLASQTPVCKIGEVKKGAGVKLFSNEKEKKQIPAPKNGYEHNFAK